MTVLYDDAMVDLLTDGARAVAGHWGLPADAPVRLLTVSENATFRADPADGAPVILRVHRPGYHTRAEIESELAWIGALRAAGVVDTPEPLRGADGGHLASFVLAGEERLVAAFTFMPGAEPAPTDDLRDGFHKLGGISARLHHHTRSWPAPKGFVRKTWDFDTTVGPRPHWGDWRAALGLTASGAALLERTCDVLHRRLAAYGTAGDRFGLIHADLRLANLLIDGDRLGVIDFDDCGFGWFGYDFAAAVSFFEHDPVVPRLQEAWVAGYREVAPLTAEDEAMLPTFVMLRRLLLTAWIASHSETPTAAAAGGAAYTDGTLVLADRFLSAA
ncbi:phosphotransferase enzyme family protein [Caenispirillum bisanense]|uniref:Ser/Thr protein kinase RdoA involved in Cpx stress response, MazF antagonist n=1 Tax=Caenispirillum bisanense TaxID=414052 RepID=A0A286G8U4_9PROT|nr:phosphotransferase [Caenispirillum bisanense]SOD91892.1 Ser/Thr protein kinase RdoA involved in Cpx stress response, MazF antagonist [Caenispirillum bisanense]